MDDHNNEIGQAIGARARTYDEVVAMAQDVMRRGIGNGGTGVDGTPAWIPDRSRWRDPDTRANKPSIDGPLELMPGPSANPAYRYGGEEHRFLAGLPRREAKPRRLADLAQAPPGSLEQGGRACRHPLATLSGQPRSAPG